MSLGRITAIAWQDLKVLRADPSPVVLLIGMPLLLMPFLKPAFAVALHVEGDRGATGAEQVVPGMAVLFGFFLTGTVSFAFFHEHAWRTWPRLRASPASTGEILAGKMLIPLAQAVAQFVVLFGLGGLLMGLHVRGSWLGMFAIAMVFGVYLVATGLAITALCKTIVQANAVVNVGALLLGGLAGALVPYSLLPGWAQTIAPAVPSYWAMQGYKDGIFGGGASVVIPILVLLGFAAASTLTALVCFRFEDEKGGLL